MHLSLALECEHYVALCNAYASCAHKVEEFVQQRACQNYLLNNIAVEETMVDETNVTSLFSTYN